MVNSTCDYWQVKAHFSLDYESRVRGKNEVLLYGNFSDPKGGKVRWHPCCTRYKIHRWSFIILLIT